MSSSLYCCLSCLLISCNYWVSLYTEQVICFVKHMTFHFTSCNILKSNEFPKHQWQTLLDAHHTFKQTNKSISQARSQGRGGGGEGARLLPPPRPDLNKSSLRQTESMPFLILCLKLQAWRRRPFIIFM